MQKHGYFELQFKFLENRWKDAILSDEQQMIADVEDGNLVISNLFVKD